MACRKSGNIILIGMPSSGKSTIGIKLAEALGKSFTDTDDLIEQREGKPLQEIINEKGNDYFHQVERTVVLGVEAENTVIATGGSAIYFPEVFERFRNDGGIIVYLEITLDTVKKRLNNLKTRGVTLGAGQTLDDLYDMRTPLYEAQCDIRVKGDDCTVEAVVERIVEALGC